MNIRTATLNDLDAVTAVEAACFPAAEAASKEEFAERLRYYGSHFWLMLDGEKLIGFVDGMVTDQTDLTDDLYEQAHAHNEQGALADDLRRQHIAGTPASGRGGRFAGTRHLRCKNSGPEGSGADL